MRHPVEDSLPVIAAKAPKTQFKTNSTLIFPPKKMYCPAKPIIPPPNEQHMVATVRGRTINDIIFFYTCCQKYSRLRCLLRVKGLVICFYLGWSGSVLQFRRNMIKVGSKSWLPTCSSNITLSLPSYTALALL